MNSFKHFMKIDIENNRKFLKDLQILDERSSKIEYGFIELIWDQIADKIYEIIDDLVKTFNFDENFRYLIIGDFFFTIISYDLTNPNDLIFKISRKDYIDKIKIRAEINKIFACESIKYINIHKKLLIGLRLIKVLEKTELRILLDKRWETIISFTLMVDKVLLDHNFWGFSENPYIVVKISGEYYSISNFRNIWKVKRKKFSMENSAITHIGVIKANQIPLYLSQELYNLNKNLIANYKKKMLNDIDLVTLDQYFESFKKVLRDKTYANRLFMNYEKIDNVKFDDVKELVCGVNREYIKIIKNYQKFLILLILEKNIFQKKMYLPCFMDNRGRQYYNTILSPTFYKMFRYLYEFNEKKKMVRLKESLFYKKIIKYKKLVEIFTKNDDIAYILIVLFIEIGKFLIKNANNTYIIMTEDIISEGIKNYTIKNTNIDFNDLLYVNKIYKKIENILKNDDIDYNTIIFKDATASGLQNYGIILGYKEEKLEYLNINGDNLCDTYMYIISKFLKDPNKKFSKRRYWKNTIMTIPYNSVWYSCFAKFLSALRQDNIEYNNFSKKEKEGIKKMHKDFYNSVKTNVKKEFFKKESGNLKMFKYNQWIVVNKTEYKINYKTGRDKYVNILYMIIYDSKATEQALEANNMHYLDAELIRYILNDYEILSIHDCIGVRLSELHLVMDKINKYYSKIIGFNTYCIHIII